MIDGFQPDALRDIITANSSDFTENSISFIFSCPRCQKAKRLYIRKYDGRFICWRCGEVDGFKGRCEWALYELFGVRPSETKPLLYGYNTELPEGTFLESKLVDWYGDDEEEPAYCTLPAIDWPVDAYEPDTAPFAKAAAYLEGRGVSKALAVKYDLRWRPSEQRVLIPVKVDGTLRGWQGRWIHQSEWMDEDGTKHQIPKILSTHGLIGGGALMFQDNLIGSDHIVLCEGPFDALKADLCGGAVASMGKGVNQRQLEFLKSTEIPKLYIAFDPDAANDISRVIQEMSHLDVYYMVPPKGKKDFGECTLEETFEAYKKAERVSPSRLFVYLKLPAGLGWSF